MLEGGREREVRDTKRVGESVLTGRGGKAITPKALFGGSVGERSEHIS